MQYWKVLFKKEKKHKVKKKEKNNEHVNNWNEKNKQKVNGCNVSVIQLSPSSYQPDHAFEFSTTIQVISMQIRHWSVTCNQIISMSTGSRFWVINHDQSDHHANSIAFIVIMKGDPVKKESRNHFNDKFKKIMGSSSLWKVGDPVTKELNVLRNHFTGGLCFYYKGCKFKSSCIHCGFFLHHCVPAILVWGEILKFSNNHIISSDSSTYSDNCIHSLCYCEGMSPVMIGHIAVIFPYTQQPATHCLQKHKDNKNRKLIINDH